ncbi:hypothetical protein ESY86_08780 [Subsaximicrobium wynnwilliamsii]|uniref:Uncharacterized protein n=1 Tax=Subsaximicrobium wynnwilliamsii TaxID=291179 RepID=A0A5C6ZH49_9FLAO|nr:hypothetical protein [Subsaximicrobium wynnwilliamsii]TXD83650.1 hypothetical protein ESY87_08425 [Subsaximicrobium wynnwilliamsii]TXD89465.1 hypothetical protein ESY86_08780 [Subsaximicrobium wynnwilliamsii]TXE03487.1 hypothetical protein ESY88_07450 [Subsaximicrobium wynnwilliamsii]
MKKSLLLLILLSVQILVAQSAATVENPPSKATDLVLFSFGMEQPIPIGTLSNSGELNINLAQDLDFISEEAKSNFMSDTAFILFSNCVGSNDMLSEAENVKAAKGGYISLSTKENPYSGLLFMVTDENMVPWIESYGDVDAILGSYFEVVYMESDFSYQGECTSNASSTEKEIIETQYTYDLNLKAGFNFIEYKIESVEEFEIPSMYEENVFEKIDKPTKISITSSQSTLPNTKWIGKYF